jgi:hypothetical protein
MAALPAAVRLRRTKEVEMGTLFTVIVVLFVVLVLALVAYSVFEITPFARHADHLRDPRTGKRRWESPHLND